jgi:hypothetical protein
LLLRKDWLALTNVIKVDPRKSYSWIGEPFLFLEGEPQVSTRILRHIFSSILPEAAKPRCDRQAALGEHLLYEPTFSHPVPHATTSEMDRMIPAALLAQLLALNTQHHVGELELSDRIDTQHQLLQLILALELYKREHSNYPERLQQLVPDILPSVPQDLFAAPKTPLGYQRDNASVKVWSIGDNLPTTLHHPCPLSLSLGLPASQDAP